MVRSSGYLKLTGGPYGKNQTPLSDQERVPAGSVPAPQENNAVVLRPEKGVEKLPLRRNPDHMSGSDEGVSLPEKPNLDGFNWRKYGQKLVKGNTFVRSYYKCTFGNCAARKQVEWLHDGNITEINYLWKHEHAKPGDLPTGSHDQSLESETSQDPEVPIVSSIENFVEVAISHSSEIENEVNNIPPDSKRQKKESGGIKDSVVRKTNYKARVVVETTSAVDIVNDGYRWRKYGQKLVKGNPNPRSYYRCVNVGCPVKKHVERASHDEKVVVTTYEGRHDHDMPAGFRTVAQNTNISSDDELNEPEPNESTGMEMVLHVGAN